MTLGSCQPIREEAGVLVPSLHSGWQEKQQHCSEVGSTARPTWLPTWTESRDRLGLLPVQPAHTAPVFEVAAWGWEPQRGSLPLTPVSQRPPLAVPTSSIPSLEAFPPLNKPKTQSAEGNLQQNLGKNPSATRTQPRLHGCTQLS